MAEAILERSANGAREKEVNLAIAEELKACLEEAGIQVVLTRSDAGGLYQESDENKKQADMRARCAIIDEAGAELTVSVHQNSYPQNLSGGPRFFIMQRLPKARRRRPASRKP